MKARRLEARWLSVSLVVGALAAVAMGPARDHGRAAALLSGYQDPGVSIDGVGEHELRLSGLRARRYATDDGGPPLLLVHGAHRGGMDDPRLRRFARLLADSGLTVVTPELPALAQLRLDPASVDRIGRAARALAHREGSAVGVLGISFGGGLALLAAADPRYRDAVAAVMAVGAHHDIGTLARFWSGLPVVGPNGESQAVRAAPYGAQVLVFNFASDYFDAPDAGTARQALAAAFEERPDVGRRLRSELSDRTKQQLDALARGRPAHLEALVEAHAEALSAISPAGRLDGLRAPVFLLHGADDPIIASTESLRLAAEIPPDARGGVVVTPLLRHAESAGAGGPAATWSVVHLVASFLGALR